MSHMDDAVREFAWNYGAEVPDQEWLLHDFDVWVKNPYYTGKPGPHPEDDSVLDSGVYDPYAGQSSDIPWYPDSEDDEEIPF